MTTPLDAILSRQQAGETRLKLWDDLVKYARELEDRVRAIEDEQRGCHPNDSHAC